MSRSSATLSTAPGSAPIRPGSRGEPGAPIPWPQRRPRPPSAPLSGPGLRSSGGCLCNPSPPASRISRSENYPSTHEELSTPNCAWNQVTAAPGAHRLGVEWESVGWTLRFAVLARRVPPFSFPLWVPDPFCIGRLQDLDGRKRRCQPNMVRAVSSRTCSAFRGRGL